MHWLYFDSGSPGLLQKAGLTYDSSWGYNDAAGFFTGTAQVFTPLGSEEFSELPLTIQDTALFFPGRMGLGEGEALVLCKDLIEKVCQFGGALVINWHDRSLAPERLWGDFYERLLEETKSRRVWFGTGSEVVGWFRKRRLTKFTQTERIGGLAGIRVVQPDLSEGPPLKLKMYGDCTYDGESAFEKNGHVETPLLGDVELQTMQGQSRETAVSVGK
jgi:hypothetical protein